MIGPSRWVVPLAVSATATAVCLSVLARWQRGGALAERLAWVAIGIVLVVSAHLLPALVRDAPPVVRGVAAVLWVACMAAACYGHATFFLLAQRHAGELRAAAVTPAGAAVPSGRSLTIVMADRANIRRQLALATSQHCTRDCSGLDARRATLTARLEALDAEAGDVRRRQAADDRAMAQRDSLVADPVTARLAALLSTNAVRVDLLSGLAFAAVLEGVACLLWTVALRSRLPAPSIATIVAPVTASRVLEPRGHETATGSHGPDNDPVMPLPATEPPDPGVTRLAQDVAAGRVRPTVADIRRYLGCSQARATVLRRQLAALRQTT